MSVTFANPSHRPQTGDLLAVEVLRDGTVQTKRLAENTQTIALLSADRVASVSREIETLDDHALEAPNGFRCLACGSSTWTVNKKNGASLVIVKTDGGITQHRTDGLGRREKEILDGFSALATLPSVLD